jgi:hypothetical protein
MRTKRRSRRRVAVVAVGALVLLNAIVMLAFTRWTTPPAPGTSVAGDVVVPPENEALLPGKADPDEYLDLKQSSASAVTEAQVKQAQAQAAEVAPAANGIAWQQLGPYNIGGRVVDVQADKLAANGVYTAVSGGGIWHSADAGANWTPVWPNDQVQTMGALAQDANGTLWVGTGEANPPGGGLTYFGDGVYKSTDEGAHWENVGLRESASIGRIAIDPSNPDRVFVAAAGHVARSAGQRGLYRTSDGGKSWQLVLAPFNATTGAIDVAVNPVNPQIVYAAMWDHKRNNGARVYGGVGSGLFRSKDGGDTWERLQNVVDPLPAYDTAQTGLKQDASLGRIGVTIAPSDPSRVYVVSGSPYGPDKGFYYSDDGGDSFHVGGRAYQTSSGYQWWFGRLWVDPKDKTHIFNADVNLRTSTNSGQTWQAISAPHADQHGMDWDPHQANRVYLGNDGGMYRSDSNGVNGSWIKATNQPWNQSYHLSVSQQDAQRMTTGLQDNGSLRTWTAAAPSPTDPALTTWNAYGGGDGHWNVIDPTDQSYYYACFQPSPPRHSCAGFHDTATSTQSMTITNNGWPSNQRWTTDTPIAIDPNNNAVIYLGGTVLGRSVNRGGAFTMISPAEDPANPTADVSLPGPVPPDENDLGPFYANEYATISAIAPAKEAGTVPYANTIYVGTDTGRVWRTDDAGAHWTRLTGVPERWVNAIVVDPADAQHVYAAFSGYRQGSDAGNVYETHDGGATWANISQNLPNGPVEMITYDAAHDVLYAATDVGVFDHKDGDVAWYKISAGLPNVPVLDVKLSGDGKYVFAATFGRSVWKLPLFTDAVDGGGTGGSVPATLALTLGPNASFGAFQPGVDREYTATTSANVVSTAGDATLSVADPDKLMNGTFSLAEPLRVELSKATWTAPVANDPVAITFKQHIGQSDPLRTGSYSTTLTFTLSTTNP